MISDIFKGNMLSLIGGCIDVGFDLKYNEKRKILLGNCISSTLGIIALIFLRAYDGVINDIVTLLRLITIYLKDKYNKKCNMLFIVFFFLYTLMFINYSGIQTIVLFACVMLCFIPKWVCKNMQIIRLFNLVASILSMTYNVLIMNYAVILIQMISFVLLVVSIIRWHIKDKHLEENLATI